MASISDRYLLPFLIERACDMKFSPCTGECTKEGTHCEGCGRSHEEVAGLSKVVNELVGFAQKMEYENTEDFASAVAKSVHYKLENPA